MPSHSLRRVLVAGAAALAAGCAGGGGGGAGDVGPATSQQTLSELFNLTGLYQRMGRLAAGAPLPFVGQYAFLAGRGDSTVVILGLSLDNRTLSFQRNDRGFVGRYRVEMSFQREGALPHRYAREEAISVTTFEETQRVGETLVFQQAFLLQPGVYEATVVVRDPESGGFSRASQAITVPTFTPGSTTAPILVYRAGDRTTLWTEPDLVLNPRGMVSHGNDSLLVYVEAYGLSNEGITVPMAISSEQGGAVADTTLRFAGGRAVEGTLLSLSSESPPLGRLYLTLAAGDSTKRTTALVSFSQSWVLTNYDNLIDLLRYFGHEQRLEALRDASPEERPSLWRRFWRETDPTPNTPQNEALDLYFTRVAIANDRFRDEGGQGGGWRTERGEVYITLGQPDQIQETAPGQDPRYERWYYADYRAYLTFEGQPGFSRMRLSAQSRAEFSRVRSLARQRQGQTP